jgi:hypothetical protein
MTYGLVEIGMCPRCNTPNFLFVHSSLQVSKAHCVRCLSRVLDGDYEPLPTAQDFPIMADTQSCKGCEKPIMADGHRWKERTAYLADNTEVVVHMLCVLDNNCVDCELTFAAYSRRGLDEVEGSLPYSRFASMNQVESDWRCDTCTVGRPSSFLGAKPAPSPAWINCS